MIKFLLAVLMAVFGQIFWRLPPVFGFLVGLLAGEVMELRRRVRRLEERLKAVPEIRPSVVPAPASEPAPEPEPESEPESASSEPEAETAPVSLSGPMEKEEAEPVTTAPVSLSEPMEKEKAEPVTAAPPEAPEEKEEKKAAAEEKDWERLEIYSLWDRLPERLSRVNPVVWVGLVVLFFGVGFLVKLAADHGLLPIELRLAGVGVLGIVLLGLGWRLRLSRPDFGLLVQGGGIGILYLTLFAGAKLYGLIPLGLAFVLMAALAGLSGALAVLQDSHPLAAYGAAGGFLAPVLTSTGAGSHVALFTYYAILNAGILGVAWFKAWRMLNLLGFGFTFVIGTTWGILQYRAEDFATTEPFLILFFLFYTLIAILFALRQPPRLRGAVDGTLVFGVPIVAFGLQGGLVHEMEYGLAFSALSLSLFYLLTATALWRRQGEGLLLLTEAFTALGVVFGSLAIPLALSGQWTASAWALEGAGLVWIGVRQGRITARIFGVLLQLGAGIALLFGGVGSADRPLLNGLFLGALCVSAAGFFSSFYLNRNEGSLRKWEKKLPPLLVLWAALYWFGGGFHEIDLYVSPDNALHAALLFIGVSTGLMAEISRRLEWPQGRIPVYGLLPGMVFIAWLTLAGSRWNHLFYGWGWFPWIFGFAAQYFAMRRLEKGPWMRGYHLATLLFAVFVLTWEAGWGMDRLAGQEEPLNSVWSFIVFGVVPALVMIALTGRGKRFGWPVAAFEMEYRGMGPLVLGIWILIWEILAAGFSGDPDPLVYLPALNPLDVAQVFSLMAVILWLREVHRERIPLPFRLPVSELGGLPAGVGLFWLTVVIARTVHFWGDIPYEGEALFRATIFQTAVSVIWSLTALGAMIFAHRKGFRKVWYGGTAVLSVVVVKLFLIDLSGSGTVSRIVSFLGVGVLMLVIGYFAPLPPENGDAVAEEGLRE